MSISKKIKNWLEKLVGKVGLVRKISSTYYTKKFMTEKIMLFPVEHLGGHGRLAVSR